MSQQDPIVIVAVARTPMGGFQGDFNALTAPQLGAVAIKAAVERAGIKPEQVEEVVFGNVLQAGIGQAPGRQAALGAGLPLSVGCTTINKMCGSALKAVMLVHDSLLAGAYEIGVAGGQESMSNAPYLLPKARGGYRLGHGQMLDHMFLDGLEDAYNKDAKGGGRLMGTFAEECAESYGFTRQAQDAFAIQSTTRAQKAINEGLFKWEIAPVTIVGKKGDVVVDKDEQPLKAQIEKIPGLKPAFKKDGTVTAANSSSISDGAAAVVLMKASKAKSLGLAPIARIVGHTTHAQEPNLFTTAPVFAIEKLLKKNGWSVADVDLWEINEAFAVVTMAAIHDLKLDPAKVNVHGGACALGHPIGASGARILVSLIGALKQYGKTRGVASLCIGGGEAVAVGVEMLKEQ
jgi:acetyl-CoA C-acetyltransferase